MYVVPTKIPVPTKKLIENFEKGELQVKGDQDDKQVLYREISREELAKPGTAKKLLMEFETMKHQEVLKSPPMKSPSAVKLKQEKLGGELGKKIESENGKVANGSMKEKCESRRVLIVSSGQSNTAVDEDLMKMTATELKRADLDVAHSYLNKCVLDEKTVLDEKQKLSLADLVIFHYRPILNTIPAKLKEWFEKVLADSFDTESGEMFETGLLKGKKCILLINTGLNKSAFVKNGHIGDASFCIWPIQNGILRFVGFEVLAPEIIYKTETSDSANFMESWLLRLLNIWQEEPIDCYSYIPPL